MHVLVFVAQTEEEYLEMMESDEVKEMKKLHVKYRESLETDLLNTMNDITQSRSVRLQIVLLHLFIGIQLNGIIIIIIIIIAKFNHLSFFGKQVHKQKQVVSGVHFKHKTKISGKCTNKLLQGGKQRKSLVQSMSSQGLLLIKP